MVKFFDCLSDELRDWALQQQVFFIASAPTNGRHINVSPKGLPASTLTVFDPNHAAYIDATGSGAETISHLYENGRATIMFCSFGKTPRIMRWFCTGRVVEYDQPEFESLLARMDKAKVEGARAVIVLEMFKVSLPLSIIPSDFSLLTNSCAGPNIMRLCGAVTGRSTRQRSAEQ